MSCPIFRYPSLCLQLTSLSHSLSKSEVLCWHIKTPMHLCRLPTSFLLEIISHDLVSILLCRTSHVSLAIIPSESRMMVHVYISFGHSTSCFLKSKAMLTHSCLLPFCYHYVMGPLPSMTPATSIPLTRLPWWLEV